MNNLWQIGTVSVAFHPPAAYGARIMALDDTDFVDRDYQAIRTAGMGLGAGTGTGTGTGTGVGVGGGSAAAAPVSRTDSLRRAPTREELDSQLTATQQQLAKLREAQEQLERARAAVEDLRRRRGEFQAGRDELRQQLGRGVGLLEKAEFESRRDAEQLGRSLTGLKEAHALIENLDEQTWTDGDWEQQLSRALTTIENARMEWNGARLKWPVLDGKGPGPAKAPPLVGPMAEMADLPFSKLCRLGLGLTWPLLVVGGSTLVALILLRWRH